MLCRSAGALKACARQDPAQRIVAERRELLGDLAQAASLSRQGTGPIEPLRLRDDFGPLLGM
jgi:hypothetical protein